MSEKLPPPAGRCTRCGAITRDRDRLLRRCGRLIGYRPCKGVFLGRLGERKWDECDLCHATGREVAGARCKQCGGDGWMEAGR